MEFTRNIWVKYSKYLPHFSAGQNLSVREILSYLRAWESYHVTAFCTSLHSPFRCIALSSTPLDRTQHSRHQESSICVYEPGDVDFTDGKVLAPIRSEDRNGVRNPLHAGGERKHSRHTAECAQVLNMLIFSVFLHPPTLLRSRCTIIDVVRASFVRMSCQCPESPTDDAIKRSSSIYGSCEPHRGAA